MSRELKLSICSRYVTEGEGKAPKYTYMVYCNPMILRRTGGVLSGSLAGRMEGSDGCHSLSERWVVSDCWKELNRLCRG